MRTCTFNGAGSQASRASSKRQLWRFFTSISRSNTPWLRAAINLLVLQDFETGNLLSPTYLSFDKFKGFDAMLAIAKAGATRHAVLTQIWMVRLLTTSMTPG